MANENKQVEEYNSPMEPAWPGIAHTEHILTLRHTLPRMLLPFAKGQRLGSGESARVFADTKNPRRVIKQFKQQEGCYLMTRANPERCRPDIYGEPADYKQDLRDAPPDQRADFKQLPYVQEGDRLRGSAHYTEATVHAHVWRAAQAAGLQHLVLAFHGAYLVGPQFDMQGTISMQRADTTLHCALHEGRLGATELAHMAFEVVFLLAYLQTVLGFKHHDLHPKNLFVCWGTPQELFADMPRQPTPEGPCAWQEGGRLHYRWPGLGQWSLPAHPWCFKLGDFGLGSVDLEGGSMRLGGDDIFLAAEEDGLEAILNKRAVIDEWTPELLPGVGYDLQYMFSQPPWPSDSPLEDDDDLVMFYEMIYNAATACAVPCKERTKDCRPIRGHVSTVPAVAVLQAVFQNGPLFEWAQIGREQSL